MRHQADAFQAGMGADNFYSGYKESISLSYRREVAEVLGFDPTSITSAQMDEAVAMTKAVMDDPSLRGMLYKFVKDYAEAQHPIEITEMAGGAVFEIVLTMILAALTAGAAAVAVAGSKARLISTFSKVGALLRKFAQAARKLKIQSRNRKAKGKPADFKDLETIEAEPKKSSSGPEGDGFSRDKKSEHLNEQGQFKDPELESGYQKYVSRKNKQGAEPRSREDWKETRDYWLNDSPMARGNAFNKKAVKEQWYQYNEVTLKNGKRLDAYDPEKGEIISRKATDLDSIDQSTFESYLKEMKKKYSPGEPINAPKYGDDLKGQVLKGKHILEVPDSNLASPNVGTYKDLAAKYDIELRFSPE